MTAYGSESASLRVFPLRAAASVYIFFPSTDNCLRALILSLTGLSSSRQAAATISLAMWSLQEPDQPN